MLEFVLARYNYWIVIVLMMTGLYIVFSRGNLVKTVVGLNIFQTSVFIFYITIGKVAGGTAPILIDQGYGEDGYGDAHGGGYEGDHGAGHDGHDAEGVELHVTPQEEMLEAGSMPLIGDPPGVEPIETARMLGTAGDAVLYSNPLPHVLILTAIVVGVATTAVGLAIAVRIREAYGTVEEDALEAMDNAASGELRVGDPA
jgi:multicomponent Na+:H+ antiporter subunit C